MANIVINSKCNLKCTYCFANEYINNNDSRITKDELTKILNFIIPSPINRIGIIGGEPTLHPDFDSIVRTVAERALPKGKRVTVFTNGILIGEHSHVVHKNVGILVNINHPESIGNQKWNRLVSSIDTFALANKLQALTFGINIYKDLKDTDFIFDMLKEYKKNFVRVSYVVPNRNVKFADKDNYYREAKNPFIEFCSNAYNNRIKIGIDCNTIPKCYFDDEELELIQKVSAMPLNSFCEPVIDITPDFKCTACFGNYKQYNMREFDNLSDIRRFLYYQMLKQSEINTSTSECKKCKMAKNMACQGGCLAFSNSYV